MKEGIKKFLISVFILLMAFSVVVAPFFGVRKVDAQDGGSWTTLAPLPMRQAVYKNDIVYTGTAVLNEKIYYIDVNMTMRYDPVTNNWTELAPLPSLNHWGTLVAYQNKIYVIGGNSEDPTQVYDPDTWENRTGIPSTRISMEANAIDGKIYVISGQQLAGLGIINPSNLNYVYDPETDSWSQMAPIPVPVMGYASAVLDDKIYIISGVHPVGGGGPDSARTNLVQIFDPATNHWTNGTYIPIAEGAGGACATTGVSAPKRIYVLGNEFNQVYDPETDTWTNATAMPTPRKGFDPVIIDDEVYVIGGAHGGIHFTVNEKYSPTDPIPEFSSWVILPLFLTATLFVIVFKKRLFQNS